MIEALSKWLHTIHTYHWCYMVSVMSFFHLVLSFQAAVSVGHVRSHWMIV